MRCGVRSGECVSGEPGWGKWGAGCTLIKTWLVVKPKVAVNDGSPVLAVGGASASCALDSSKWPPNSALLPVGAGRQAREGWGVHDAAGCEHVQPSDHAALDMDLAGEDHCEALLL